MLTFEIVPQEREAALIPFEGMLKHINKHQDIMDQLVSVGADDKEQEKVWKLFLSLPGSYDNPVNTLEFSDELTL